MDLENKTMKIANPKITRHNTNEDGIHTVNLINMILNEKNKLVKKTNKHNAPYSPIKLSTMDGKKHKTTSSLLDTGADIPVISHGIALELGAQITPTWSKARDTME